MPKRESALTRKRRQHLPVAVLLDVHVEKELDERPGQARGRAREDRESRTRDLGGALEVEDAERRAEVPVRLGLEVEPARLSPRALDAVRRLVGASGNRVLRDVGNLLLDRRELSVRFLDAFLERANLFLQGLHLGERRGIGLSAERRNVVAAAALLLEAGHRFSALGVEIRIGLEAGASEALRHLPQQACRVLA